MERKGEYWDPEIETMPLEEVRKIQLEKIKSLVKHAYDNAPFYRKRFDEAGVKPEDIKTLDDFRKKIPIFRKEDVRAEVEGTGDPFGGMLTVPLEELDAIHCSTGTTGIPTLTGLTTDEIDRFGDAIAKCIWGLGVRPGMRIMSQFPIFCPHRWWHWGSSLTASVDKIGGCEIFVGTFIGHVLGISVFDDPISKFEFDLWGLLVLDFVGAALDECNKRGIDPKDVIKAKRAVTAGEILTPLLRNRYEEKFGCQFYDGSGASEVMGHAIECYVREGGNHYQVDQCYIEIIEPDTGELLEAPGIGEIVATNLYMRAVPWIRFATEDYSELHEERCKCGRTSPRMKTVDRTGNVLKIKDKRITPYDVRLIFEGYPETEGAVFNMLKYSEQMDRLKMNAYYNPAITKNPDELKNKLVREIKQKHGVDAEIEWIPWGKIGATYKVQRVIDLTKK